MLRVTADRRIEATSPLALNASVEPEARLVVANRAEELRTKWLVNFSSKLLLDFDEAGRLGAIEIVVPIHRWPRSSVRIPAAREMVVLQLCGAPAESATLTHDEQFNLRRGSASHAVEISFQVNSHFDHWFAIGPNVFAAIRDGALGAISMRLP